MQPKTELDVLDDCNGFTCLTKLGTLWRPASVLKHGTIGILQSFDCNSFFQLNNDVTKAIYKVKGYNYPIVLWFDNRTEKRIA